MNATQLAFVVEGAIVLAAVILGALLGRKAKPYGKVKLGVHLFFFLWFTMGYYFIAQVLFTAHSLTGTGIAVIVMGLALLVQIATGITLLVKKERAAWLPLVHGASATVLLVADLAAFLLSGTKA
jgi:hypothetical protein